MKKFFHGIKVGLFGIHLWFQLVYIILFVIVSLVSNTIGTNWDIFFMGLSPTFLVSLILTYRDKKHAQEINEILKSSGTKTSDIEIEEVEDEKLADKKEEPKNEKPPITEKEIKQDNVAFETEATINSQIGSAQDYSQPLNYSNPYHSSYVQPQQNPTYSQPQYFQDTQPVKPSSYMDNMNNGTQDNDFQNYIPPHHAIPGFNPAPQVEKVVEKEKPKIYRTRSDENTIIYDYSDRTEYYRIEEDNSMTLKQTKYKK